MSLKSMSARNSSRRSAALPKSFAATVNHLAMHPLKQISLFL